MLGTLGIRQYRSAPACLQPHNDYHVPEFTRPSYVVFRASMPRGMYDTTLRTFVYTLHVQEDNEMSALWPQGSSGSANRARLGSKNSQRSQAALSRVIVTFLKSMVGSYILYTPKVLITPSPSCDCVYAVFFVLLIWYFFVVLVRVVYRLARSRELKLCCLVAPETARWLQHQNLTTHKGYCCRLNR